MIDARSLLGELQKLVGTLERDLREQCDVRANLGRRVWPTASDREYLEWVFRELAALRAGGSTSKGFHDPVLGQPLLDD